MSFSRSIPPTPVSGLAEALAELDPPIQGAGDGVTVDTSTAWAAAREAIVTLAESGFYGSDHLAGSVSGHVPTDGAQTPTLNVNLYGCQPDGDTPPRADVSPDAAEAGAGEPEPGAEPADAGAEGDANAGQVPDAAEAGAGEPEPGAEPAAEPVDAASPEPGASPAETMGEHP